MGQEEQLKRMEGAVHQLLLGVGEDPAREGLLDTPRVRGVAVAGESAEDCRRRRQVAAVAPAAPASR